MNKLFTLLLAALASISYSHAQISAYTFTAGSGTFTEITGGTYVSTLSNDNGTSAPIPIGFDFVFNGVTYTQVIAVSDGFLSFNPSAVSVPVNNLATSAATVRPLLAPLWDNLRAAINITANRFSYVTTGTTGSRIFTAEWKGWTWNTGGVGNTISFQVKLYEGSNQIDFIYRSEAGAVTGGSASIGIAGSALGSGNFLSLNNTGTSPVASSSTETTTLSTKPATGQVYSFTPPPPPAIDLNITSINTSTSICPDPSFPVTVIVKNAGINAIDFSTTNAAVSIGITGPVTQTLSATIGSGLLAPGASRSVTLPSAVNLSANGTYNFKASVAVAGDGNTSNDTTITSTTLIAAATPWTEPFATASLPLGWENKGWFVGTLPSADITGNPGNSIYRNILSDTAIGAFTTLFAGPVSANTQLGFDYRLTTSLSPYTPPAPGLGNFMVQVSTDCGGTFTTIDTVTDVRTGWISKSYPLAAYAGPYVKVRIVPKWATGNYFLAFDNFSIKVPPAIDMRTVRTTVNVGACPYSNVPVSVTLKNDGTNPIDFAANNAQVKVNITGPIVQTLTKTVNAGMLAPGDTQTVIISPGATFTTGGTYTFKTFVAVAGDNNTYNDTATSSATVAATTINSTPWAEPFTSPSVPTGWSAPGWSFGATSIINSSLGYHLYRYLSDNTSSNIITTTTVGPVNPNNRLSFDYRLADNNIFSRLPSNGWGNFKVQISTGCSGTYTTIDSVTDQGSLNGWTNKSYPLAAYAGQYITVRLVATWASGAYSICFDNFQIYSPPATDLAIISSNYTIGTCPQSGVPGSMTVKNRGTSMINFGNTNAELSVTVARGTSGGQYTFVNITSGTLAPDSSITVALVSNIDFTGGIYELTSYIALTGDSNTYNNVSLANKEVSYQTAAPWAEPFVTTSTPTGWSVGGWAIGAARGATGNPEYCIYKNFIANAPIAEIKTVVVGPILAHSVLSFDCKLSNYTSPYDPPAAGWGNFKVQVSTNCGVNFTTIDSITALSSGWINKSYSLSAYTGQRIMTRIIGTWTSGDYDLAFDNFKIEAFPVCDAPVVQNADSITTITTAQIYFYGTGNNFIVEYGLPGFTPGTGDTAGTGGTIIRTTTAPVNISGLTPGTTYQIYIRQNCTATGLGYSINSIVDTFRTKSLLLNDLPATATILTVGAGCISYSNFGATKSANEPSISCSGSQTNGKTVWFKFRAPPTGFVRVSTDGANNTLADTKAALFSATDSSNFTTFQILACDDDNGTVSSTASILYANNLTPGAYYYIAVDDYNGLYTGNFCLKVDEVNAGMIAGTGSCTQGQTVPEIRADYKSWLSLTNNTGQLISNVRSNTTLSNIVSYTPYVNVHPDSVRQSASGEYYLSRNFRIVDTLAGNYDVQFFLLNTELSSLQAVLPATMLTDLNVTKVKGEAACNPNFVSGGTGNDSLLIQANSGTAGNISWVTINTNGFSNFYLHPGAMQLSRIYVFTGNGNWSNAVNWRNNEVPPATLPPHCAIEIMPAPGGQCIMDVIQQIPYSSKFRVKSGTNMIIPGSIIIQ